MNEEEETRLRNVEQFIAELRGGRKLFIWVCSTIGGALGLLGVFWERLFGGGS